MDSFQIIESENSFLFKNEISSSAAPRIRQYIDTIAMLYSFACGIDQIVEIITILVNSTENIGISFYWVKLTIVNYSFQLIEYLIFNDSRFHIMCKFSYFLWNEQMFTCFSIK